MRNAVSRTFLASTDLAQTLYHSASRPVFPALVVGIALSLPTSGPALSQAGRQVQRYGPVSISALTLEFQTDPQGRLRIVATGDPVLTADVNTPEKTVNHYELKARTLSYFLTRSATLASATADGDVRMLARTPLPAGKEAAAGERVLVVTGDHAVFEGALQTVDVTGSPRIELTDPQFARPAIATGAVLLHVDLHSQTFRLAGDATHRVTFTGEPAASLETPAPRPAGHV